MKKSLIIFALSTILLGACSSYSCPTYAKKSPKTVALEKQQEKI